MSDLLNIGLVVADDGEYAAIENYSGISLKENNFYKRKGHTFSIKNNNRIINVNSVLCGIGKVNAACATQYLIDKGADVILNFGLSGGISGVRRGEDIIGIKYFEHDFDLTCIGYKPCEKPSQEYIYSADKTLVKTFQKDNLFKKTGVFASGDCFVSDNNLRERLHDLFNAACCDMETAAIAYTAYSAGVPFACLRRVSDDAGDTATDDYLSMNGKSDTELFEKVLTGINNIIYENSFWTAD